MVLYLCISVLLIVFLTAAIYQWILYTASSSEIEPVTIVVVPDSAESCEETLRRAAEHMKRHEPQRKSYLICLNPTDDKEINSICRCLSQRYHFLSVSNCADLGYNVMQVASETYTADDIKE